jgi:hypothetical protein
MSCERKLGYGVMLWHQEETGIESGAIVPVYIRSNIEKVWVVGVPPLYRQPGQKNQKTEVPLPMLELAGSMSAAKKRAAAFAPFAEMYAQTLQDGLPIREATDNSSRRVYRLRSGEIIKILGSEEGVPAISATGDPLPGEWFRVLTQDGTKGYCFSYRLRVFNQSVWNSAVAENSGGGVRVVDSDLERLLALSWVSEDYSAELESGRPDLDDIKKNWSFTVSEDSGTAHVFTRDYDLTFHFNAIVRNGEYTWNFEGSPLQLRSDGSSRIELAWQDSRNVTVRTYFVNLSTSLQDIIAQEEMRRDALFKAVFEAGPVFSSANYGTFTLTEDSRFTWTNNDKLVPVIIPEFALSAGSVKMDVYLGEALLRRYNGALTLAFDTLNGEGTSVRFLYAEDEITGGIRLEYLPPSSLQKNTAVRRAATPFILHFYQGELF